MQTKKRYFLTIGLALIFLLGLIPVSSQASEPDPAGAQADFGGDSYADLAIGVPFDEPGGVYDAGAVNVAYGSSSGIVPLGVEHWHQDRAGTKGTADPSNAFGFALASGDFDGDGYYDLAVGIPGEFVDGLGGAGAVHIIYGANGGLTATGDQIWNQDSGGFSSPPEFGDGFGRTLAAGDFDGDGYDDLAIGVPFEEWDAQGDGIVNILYGTSAGLAANGSQTWRQGGPGLPESGEIGDNFGRTLAVGDFNNDGRDDLAIGVEKEDFEDPLPEREAVGVVHVLYGTNNGLSATDNDLWHQDRTDLFDQAEEYDSFGRALIAGDFDGDGFDDLAIGVSGENDGGIDYAGAVVILPGHADGLTAIGDQLIYQDDLAQGTAQYSDSFGSALASSDFDGDGFDDLAVGVPGEDFWDLSPADCGAVNVIYGSELGLSPASATIWYQGLAGVADEPEANDQFGDTLAAGDFNGDGYGDLVIGVPFEDTTYQSTTIEDAGMVHVLYGSAAGISGGGDVRLYQDNLLILDEPGVNEWFGFALAVMPQPMATNIFLPMVSR